MCRLLKFYWFTLLISLVWLIPVTYAADVIGPDDVLKISVYGHDDLKLDTRVSADGRITYPLIGEVVVNGKSAIDLEETISKKLIEGGFIHNPQVSVVVFEHVSQYVSVLGYVNKPGRYPLDSTSSVVDLIAMAGGIINGVGDTNALITRTINGKPERQQLNLRTYLENPDAASPFKMQQGDVLYVPKAQMFYIYGEVMHPGGYPLEPELNVVKAISLGGGLTLRGTENRIHIKRIDSKGELEEIDAELNNPVLKDDVIYVGERWF
jgi:polysaccharide export outer membrane protein